MRPSRLRRRKQATMSVLNITKSLEVRRSVLIGPLHEGQVVEAKLTNGETVRFTVTVVSPENAANPYRADYEHDLRFVLQKEGLSGPALEMLQLFHSGFVERIAELGLKRKFAFDDQFIISRHDGTDLLMVEGDHLEVGILNDRLFTASLGVVETLRVITP